MPRLQALTIDFWNTLVEARVNGPARHARRMAYVLETVRRHRPGVSLEAVEAAFRATVKHFDAVWRTRHCTPPTDELVHHLWQTLAVTVTPERHAETVRLFQEGLLDHPPALVAGAEEILPRVATRYRLALISDTMFSPGRVIRRLLDRHGLLRCFDAFVFSDETGFSKPDVRAFRLAADALDTTPEALLHIGDLRRTDVAGALSARARAALFTGVHTDTDEGPDPHHILPRWHDLPTLL